MHHLRDNAGQMRYLVHGRAQLLLPQEPERKDETYFLIDKGQGEACAQPTPPVSDLLEQIFETTPIIPENIREEAPLVRMMKHNVNTGPNCLVQKIRVRRLL